MACRNLLESEGIVGYFINPVVIRGNLGVENLSFRDFLHKNRRVVLAALSNQEYPFGLLVERLHTSRDRSRSPIFQVMFVLQKLTLTLTLTLTQPVPNLSGDVRITEGTYGESTVSGFDLGKSECRGCSRGCDV